MFPKHRLEELKGETIRIFIKNMPEAYSIQLGKIENVGEHVVIVKDEDHDNLIYIPVDNIAFIKKP
ncbi:MAG: hypothetical protein EU535_01870 [Promethearchaeota archaeon]|nr:MAG: hypothetical protein EU535_01870 [Candidatus Lokiarchaeota archaeon]